MGVKYLKPLILLLSELGVSSLVVLLPLLGSVALFERLRAENNRFLNEIQPYFDSFVFRKQFTFSAHHLKKNNPLSRPVGWAKRSVPITPKSQPSQLVGWAKRSVPIIQKTNPHS